MTATCVVGLQWGDEAKGKVVDWLAESADVVVRFNGGANAGHTVKVGEAVYKLSLIPSGIVHSHLSCVIGNGLALSPNALLHEIDDLEKRGLGLQGRLFISDRAHVIFPYHIEEERVYEETAAGRAIGTTRRGIGPCYADKIYRLNGIRVGDLLDAGTLLRKLSEIVPVKNRVLRGLDTKAEQFDVATITDQYAPLGERLRPYVTDTFWYLQHQLAANKSLLFETAQGSLLDIDHGSYPYVTSSNSSACGLSAGCGVPSRRITQVIGVAKAYTTRVGGGPMPTELLDATGEHIRREGREFGTVTGRPRRCGWFDAVATRYAALLNGIDAVAVMLLDVLGKLDVIQVCEAYELDGERTTEFPANIDELARCKPVYRSFPGWKIDLSTLRRPEDLPTPARRYLDWIAETLNVPIILCSVGPAREETIRFT